MFLPDPGQLMGMRHAWRQERIARAIQLAKTSRVCDPTIFALMVKRSLLLNGSSCESKIPFTRYVDSTSTVTCWSSSTTHSITVASECSLSLSYWHCPNVSHLDLSATLSNRKTTARPMEEEASLCWRKSL